jgi:hypothetical protein
MASPLFEREAAMDWTAAIERHREALKRIVAGLVAMAGLVPPDVTTAEQSRLPPVLPRHLHRAVLALLRPAEAAARRLVIVASRGLVVAAARLRQPEPKKCWARLPSRAALPRPPVRSLPLFDPPGRPFAIRRPVAAGVPRIWVPGWSVPFPLPVRRPPSPHDPIDATRVALRLTALDRALGDLPGQARRFARWQARRDAAITQLRESDATPTKQSSGAAGIRRIWPLRMGNPPGFRRRPTHAVHQVLDDVHGLAFWVLEAPDTS